MESPKSDIKSTMKLDAKTLGHLRTTSRNNVDRINIADQKASVLMSLNAIMITILIPSLIANLDTIIDNYYYIPLTILGITCAGTLYLTASALKPTAIGNDRSIYNRSNNPSPFFFGNFYRMTPSEFKAYYQESLANDDHLAEYAFQDIFHIGKIVARKYDIIRRAYMLFLNGLFVVLVACIIIVLI